MSIQHFYNLRYVTCTTAVDVYIVTVENFCYDSRSAFLLDLGNPYWCLLLHICYKTA